MKFLVSFLITILASVHVMAEKDCPDYDYKELGWIIHNSSEFESILNDTQQKTVDGVLNSSMVEDIDGIMMTQNSSIEPFLYVKVNTWDVLSTSQDLMYGDIAIFSDLVHPENALEVRWFDGKNKHIVFNDRYMYCISTKQPHSANTIY